MQDEIIKEEELNRVILEYIMGEMKDDKRNGKSIRDKDSNGET